jgi:hypothetical protein
VRGAWQMLSMVRRQPRCVPLDDVPEIRNWVQVQHHRRAGARSTEHHRRAGRTQADPSTQADRRAERRQHLCPSCSPKQIHSASERLTSQSRMRGLVSRSSDSSLILTMYVP